MSRRPTVMISSTARDLPEHRDEVRKGCHRAGFASDQMMENLTALNEDAIEISLKMVEDADIYLGIFAYRYGYVPDGSDISITEMEYNKAVELGKPRLIFFIHEDHPVTGKDIERGAGSTKLEAFKQRVGTDRVVAFFKSPGDLRSHVVEALIQLKKGLEGGQQLDPKETARRLHRRTPIPRPPTPYIAHPYTLSQTRDLIGRREELNALTDWVAKPGSPAHDAAIFCFVAIGGMGKSALTWKWFRDIAPEEMPDLAGRLWWSFYESDAYFENFLNRVLCYVGEHDEDDVRNMPWQDREALLLQHLNEKPYLLVLDGLERILLAYNRMDASMLADDDYDRQTANHVAGAAGLPASVAQSFTGQHRLRQTADLRAGHFLRKLAQVEKSRILISTRLYPLALQLPNTKPCPGCFAYFLKGLSEDDAVALWRQLGVSGSRQELVTLFDRFERHPLLVQALASEIARDRKTPGDFAAWRDNNSSFDPASLPATQVKSHILQYALAGLEDDVLHVLRTIAAFRMPTTYESLEALLAGSGKTFVRLQDLDCSLAELEDRGLVGWDRDANRYDVHPVVRGIVQQLTRSKKQKEIFSIIEGYFQSIDAPQSSEADSLEDLTSKIEHFHALSQLHRYDDAFALMREHMNYPLTVRLGATREFISWLEQLFPDGLEKLPRLSQPKAQSRTLEYLGRSYMGYGRPGHAIDLLKRADTIDESSSDGQHQQIVLANLGIGLRDIGSLRQSAHRLLKALSLSRSLKDPFWEGECTQELGRVYATAATPLATIGFKRSCSIWRKSSDHLRHFESESSAYAAEMYIWLGNIKNAAFLLASAEAHVEKKNNDRDFIIVKTLRGHIAEKQKQYDLAEEQYHEGLSHSRDVCLGELEAPILISLSNLSLVRNKYETARAQLDDVWDAVEQGPYPLYQADAYNVLADICLTKGDAVGAIDAATKAYRAAWCDGPPWTYHWGLEKARAHLQALGAPEPNMPPFDESKYDPMPEVEINPKDEFWVDTSEPLEASLDLP